MDYWNIMTTWTQVHAVNVPHCRVSCAWCISLDLSPYWGRTDSQPSPSTTQEQEESTKAMTFLLLPKAITFFSYTDFVIYVYVCVTLGVWPLYMCMWWPEIPEDLLELELQVAAVTWCGCRTQTLVFWKCNDALSAEAALHDLNSHNKYSQGRRGRSLICLGIFRYWN